MKISDFFYWLRTHTIHRYHIINLKQPKDAPIEYAYDWGWIDRSEAIVLANFKLFCEFIEKEILPMHCVTRNQTSKRFEKNNKTWEEVEKIYSVENDPKKKDYKLSDGTIEDFQYETELEDRKWKRELFAIYRWWKVTRIELCKKEDEAVSRWASSRSKNDKEWCGNKKSKKLLNECSELEDERLRQEEDMLIRIIKIRGSLWR